MKNYEEKYKEDLEAAKGWLTMAKENNNTIAIQILEKLFPELKESEDERIRKEIISFITDRKNWFPKEETKSSWIAWLEKQANIPHFTFDDILALQCAMKTTEKADDELYEQLKSLHDRLRDVYWLEKQGEQKPADKVEPKFKVGDWCIDNEDDTIFQIVKVLDNTYTYKTNGGEEYSCTHYSLENDTRLWTIQDAKDGDVLVNGSNIFIFHAIDGTRLIGYCHVNTDDSLFYNDLDKNECFCLIDDIVTPATKEQRDLLFSKMKEAGYEWDAEKKELKKIEQNPAWSEEDEKMISLLIKIFEVNHPNEHFKVNPIGTTNMEAKSTKEIVDWLKSLKDRVKPQTKQEWSEDDEFILNSFLHKLEVCDLLSNKEITWIKNKLKSINHWKPSEEQIEELEYVTRGNSYPHLTSLYNDLKTFKS